MPNMVASTVAVALSVVVLSGCGNDVEPAKVPSLPSTTITAPESTTAATTPAFTTSATAESKMPDQPDSPDVAPPTRHVTQPAPSAVYYKNCAAARAAGAAPLHRGEPGYRTALDADKDGTACE